MMEQISLGWGCENCLPINPTWSTLSPRPHWDMYRPPTQILYTKSSSTLKCITAQKVKRVRTAFPKLIVSVRLLHANLTTTRNPLVPLLTTFLWHDWNHPNYRILPLVIYPTSDVSLLDLCGPAVCGNDEMPCQ